MPGQITRDSLAKSAPSNDLYAMIRNPSAKMPVQPKQVDSIQSLQTQMENDAVAQLGKTMEKFIFVARAGKFVFLAITLPPYILIYGLPKWILVDVIPFLFQQAINPFALINEKLKKAFKLNVENKGLIPLIHSTFSAVSTKGAEYIKWIDRATQALFVHLKHQIIALSDRLLKPCLPLVQKSVVVAEAVTKALQKTYAKGDKHIVVARQFVSFAWQIAKQELVSYIRPFIELGKNQFLSMQKKAAKLMEKPRLEIQKFKKKITTRLKQIHEVVKSTSQNISKNVALATSTLITYTARPIIEWVTPKIQWSTSLFRMGSEKVIQNFEKISHFVRNVTAGTLDFAKLTQQVVITTVKQVFDAAIPSFVKQFFNPEGGFKNKFKQMGKNFKTQAKKWKEKLHRLAIDTLQATKRGLFNFLRNVLLFLKQLPRRIANLVVSVYRLLIHSLIRIGQFFQWLSLWSRVLCRLAWLELRETAAAFFIKVPK